VIRLIPVNKAVNEKEKLEKGMEEEKKAMLARMYVGTYV
jgi:hypothetical protein